MNDDTLKGAERPRQWWIDQTKPIDPPDKDGAVRCIAFNYPLPGNTGTRLIDASVYAALEKERDQLKDAVNEENIKLKFKCEDLKAKLEAENAILREDLRNKRIQCAKINPDILDLRKERDEAIARAAELEGKLGWKQMGSQVYPSPEIIEYLQKQISELTAERDELKTANEEFKGLHQVRTTNEP